VGEKVRGINILLFVVFGNSRLFCKKDYPAGSASMAAVGLYIFIHIAGVAGEVPTG